MSNIKSKEQASINAQVRRYMSGPSKIIKLNNDDLKDLAGQVEKNVPDQSDVPIKNFQMRIAKDGVWYYQGTSIKRPALVKLFASVLQKESDGTYWLVTPVEKGMIEVEDAPFLAVGVEYAMSKGVKSKDANFVFRTNLDELVICGPDNPLRVSIDPQTEEPNPYVLVRKGLEARITRSVFYELVDIADETIIDEKRVLGIWSKGTFFQLGQIDSD
ncbi:MAG: DUF1285 domain-containing protein [Rhodospirillaceae bacterium]|nr:DUF1285 domain-containing protein [Rhodospirillaceae bacterium]